MKKTFYRVPKGTRYWVPYPGVGKWGYGGHSVRDVVYAEFERLLKLPYKKGIPPRIKTVVFQIPKNKLNIDMVMFDQDAVLFETVDDDGTVSTTLMSKLFRYDPS